MKTCRNIHDQASDLLAGELSRSERLVIRLHLMMCSHCRRFMRHLELLANSLRAHANTTVPPPALVERIIAAGQAEQALAPSGLHGAAPRSPNDDSVEHQ
jgi:predicted anti-sigma-YlaC factor YlaD